MGSEESKEVKYIETDQRRLLKETQQGLVSGRLWGIPSWGWCGTRDWKTTRSAEDTSKRGQTTSRHGEGGTRR